MRLYEDEKLVDALVEEKVLLWSSKNLSLNLHGIDAVSTAGARPPLVEVPTRISRRRKCTGRILVSLDYLTMWGLGFRVA